MTVNLACWSTALWRVFRGKLEETSWSWWKWRHGIKSILKERKWSTFECIVNHFDYWQWIQSLLKLLLKYLITDLRCKTLYKAGPIYQCPRVCRGKSKALSINHSFNNHMRGDNSDQMYTDCVFDALLCLLPSYLSVFFEILYRVYFQIRGNSF